MGEDFSPLPGNESIDVNAYNTAEDLINSVVERVNYESTLEYSCSLTPLDDIRIDSLEGIDSWVFTPDFFKKTTRKIKPEIKQIYKQYFDKVLAEEGKSFEQVSTLEEIINLATLVAWRGTSSHDPDAANGLLDKDIKIDLNNPLPTKCSIFNESVAEIVETILKIKFGDNISQKVRLMYVSANFSPDLTQHPYNYAPTGVAHGQLLVITQVQGRLNYTVIDPYFSSKHPQQRPQSLNDLKSLDKTLLRSPAAYMSLLYHISPLHLGAHISNLDHFIDDSQSFNDEFKQAMLKRLRQILLDRYGRRNNDYAGDIEFYFSLPNTETIIPSMAQELAAKLRKEQGMRMYISELEKIEKLLGPAPGS